MNQTFDRAFEDIKAKLNLSWKDIELLLIVALDAALFI
jgi:hypothetical protein